MATISVGNRTGRKALDNPIPLVPFIDLLLCCVMFLLVTAVWNDLAGISVGQSVPGPSIDIAESPREALMLMVHRDAYEIASLSGDRRRLDASSLPELGRALVAFRDLHRDSALTVFTDDGVPYGNLIHALDQARAAGFRAIDVTGPGQQM